MRIYAIIDHVKGDNPRATAKVDGSTERESKNTTQERNGMRK